jgi:hypothetical protein
MKANIKPSVIRKALIEDPANDTVHGFLS